MTYIDYLNYFNQWLETNALPASSQLMYFKLLNIFNRAGWPEYVGVDTLRLQIMLDGAAKTTVTRARDKLVEAGFIEYQKGRKGAPNRYRLVKIQSNIATASATENATISATASATENATHIKTKTKIEDKENKEKKEKRACEPLCDKEVGRVMAEYQQYFGINYPTIITDELINFCHSLGADVCIAAIHRAIEVEARNWKYVKTVLSNCERNNIRSLADWERAEARHNNAKKQSQAQNAEPENSKWDNLPGITHL